MYGSADSWSNVTLITLVVAALGAIFSGGFYWHFSRFENQLKANANETHTRSRLRAANALIAPSWWSHYIRTLRNGLVILDRWMGPLHQPIRGLSWCLIAAYIYPLGLLLFGWLFGGLATIGNTEILPPASQISIENKILFIITVLLPSIGIFLITFNARIIDAWMMMHQNEFFTLFFPANYHVFIGHILALAVAALAVATIYCFLDIPLWLALTIAGALSGAAVGALAAAGAIIIVLAGAGASIAALGGSAAIVAGSSLAAAFAGFYLRTVVTVRARVKQLATSAAVLPAPRIARDMLKFVSLDLGQTIIIISIVAAAAWISDVSLNAKSISTWVLFWTLLPLLNALLDLLSWTISRWLSNNLLQVCSDPSVSLLRRAWVYARDIALDFIAASLLLACLAWGIPRTVELWNSIVLLAGKYPPLELRDYLCAAAKAPLTDGLWATGMLFSTLIPTVLHLSIIAVAPLIWCLTPTDKMRARAGHIAFGWRPPDADLKGISKKDRERWPSMQPAFGQRTLPDHTPITTQPLHPPTVSAVAWTLRFWRPLIFIGTFIVVLTVIWQFGTLAAAVDQPLPQLLLWVAHNFDWPAVQACLPGAPQTAPLSWLWS